jgi:hypothetical protein
MRDLSNETTFDPPPFLLVNMYSMKNQNKTFIWRLNEVFTGRDKKSKLDPIFGCHWTWLQLTLLLMPIQANHLPSTQREETRLGDREVDIITTLVDMVG